MRASRLLSIQLLLQARGRMSATALAGKLEVSVRTLYRDIDELSAAGVPVYAERGRAGGFSLLPGWTTQLTGMTAGEAEAVFLSGLDGPAAELGLASELRTAQLKLRAALPPPLTRDAGRVSERLHLDPGDWYREPEQAPHLHTLAQAVWEGRRLEISYVSWSRSARHEVHPLGLVLKAGTWYLVAMRDGKLRTFRAGNVTEARVLEAACSRPRGFDLAAAWRESVQRFERELHRDQAEVAATARGLSHLRQVSAVVARALRDTRAPTGTRRVRVRVPVESVEQASAVFLRLAPEVEVLQPAQLRQAVRARAESIVHMYAARARPRTS